MQLSRLSCSRSALLAAVFRMVVVVVAAGIVLVAGGDPAERGYSVTRGVKWDATEEIAVLAKLSSGANQESWWQLGKTYWHDSALDRFFAGGPLQADHMKALASQDGKSNSWKAAGMSSAQGPTDLVSKLQSISTTTYRMDASIAGTGKIEASMWTLMFQCIDPSSCSQGMLPLVIVPNGNPPFSYATVWLPVTPNLLLNAIPASIALLPAASPFASSAPMSDVDDSALSLTINVRGNSPSCLPTPAIAHCRSSILDSTYGLMPGFSCIELGTGHQAFKLLVYVPGRSSVGGAFTNRDQFLINRLNVSTWKTHPFEACSEEPLLSSDESFSMLLCYKAFCTVFSTQNVTCESYPDESESIMYVKAGYAAVKSSMQCTLPEYADQPHFDSDQFYSNFQPTVVSCQFSASQVCNLTILPANLTALYSDNGDRLIKISSVSSWSSTKGKRTWEFQQAAQVNQPLPCIVPLRSLSLYDDNVTNSTQAAPPQTIQIRARSYLTSFIAEHNMAFNTAKGPAIDLYTFTALIVSTAISVILAVSWPFTNFLLKKICRKCPLYLESHKGEEARRSAKVFLQVMCNMMTSMVFFLPVLSVAYNELQREQTFYTWDLGSSDLDLYVDTASSYQSSLHMKLRVLYLMRAISNYDSHFLSAIIIAAGMTCVIVAVCTAWRCIQIFARYSLLQEYDMGVSAVPIDHGHVHGAPLQLQRAFRAIEMTEADFLDITRKVWLRLPAALQLGCSPRPRSTPAGNLPFRTWSLPAMRPFRGTTADDTSPMA